MSFGFIQRGAKALEGNPAENKKTQEQWGT